MDEAKSRALDNTGRVFARTGEFAKAIAVWEQKLESPFPISLSEKAWLCHELGYCYIEIEGFSKARECGEKSLEAARAADDKSWQLNASILVSQALLHAGEAYLSKAAFEKALVLATEAGDDKAKDSIQAALDEINKVIAVWKESEPEVTVKADDKGTNSRQTSSKSKKSPSDWLLRADDNDTSHGVTSEVTSQGHSSAARSKSGPKVAEAASDSDSNVFTTRQTMTATYVGGKDSDFAITTSADSADDEVKVTRKPAQTKSRHLTAESERKTPATDRKPPIRDSRGRPREVRRGRDESGGWKPVAFSGFLEQTTSPARSPLREAPSNVRTQREASQNKAQPQQREHSFNARPKREVSFSKNSDKNAKSSNAVIVTRPRREVSFSWETKREKATEETPAADDSDFSSARGLQRATAVYTYTPSRELSNVSARGGGAAAGGGLRRERSNVSSRNSKKNKSTNDLLSEPMSAKQRRGSVDKNAAFLTEMSNVTSRTDKTAKTVR